MPLKSLNVENAKAKEKPYTLCDGSGLHLLVTSNGTKLWRFRYRYAGKANMLSFGSFPEVSLAAARAKRDQAREKLTEGKDPSQQRKLAKLAAVVAANNTFGAIAEEHLQVQKESGIAATTLAKNRWMLFNLAAVLTNRPIAEITPAEVLAVLRHVEKSGRRETARKLRGAIGKIFRVAIASLRATTDPTYALRDALAAPVVTHRPAITEEKDLGALALAIDEYNGWPTLRAALQFLMLTMTRPIEVRLMRRNEVLWPKATWRIPAERMKMRRVHEVPLSKQALAVLRDTWDLTEGDRYIFPSIRSPLKPLSGKRTQFRTSQNGLWQGGSVCAHGFRSSASTILNERGYNPDVIEAALLAHQDEDEVRRAYNRARYWPERTKLLQDWGDMLDQFKVLSAAKRTA